jgi:hypothetical protein
MKKLVRKPVLTTSARVFSTSLNMLLFASVAPAMAHGSSAAGHGFLSPQVTHNAGNFSNLVQHFGGSSQTLVHPHATGLANTLPLGGITPSLSTFNAAHTGVQSTLNAAALTAPHPTFTANHSRLYSFAPIAVETVELDLSSSKTSVAIPTNMITSTAGVTIAVNGVNTTFHGGDSVTPAELVAIQQVQSGAGQSLNLDSQGRASGGSFSLNTVLANSGPIHLSGVVVPQNVQAYDYVTGKASLSLAGDLLNYGSIVDVTKTGSTASATINAVNIVNETGGSITTVGQGANAGSVDLYLNASNSLTNAGNVTSSGNINLQAPHIINSGLISTATGNVTLGTSGDQALVVNNTGGTISAPAGAINVRDAAYAGISDTSVVGGDLLSQKLNLNSGGGTIDLSVNKLTGVLNSTGDAVHVAAHTDLLTLGSQSLTGDPTYFNIGDFLLGGDINVAQDLAIFSTGNILATSGLTSISAKDASNNGRNITIAAGVKLSGGITTPLVVSSGPNGNGGNVDLTGASPTLTISSAGSGGSATAGNITIAAMDGNGSNGKVLLPAGSILDASGPGGNGNISVIAAAKSGTAISIGSIQNIASPLNSGANTIKLMNNFVVLTTFSGNIVGSIAFQPDGTSNGTFAPYQVNVTGIGNGAIIANSSVVGSGNIYIEGGSSITVNNVVSKGGAVAMAAAGGDLTFSGSISAPAGIALVSNHNVIASVPNLSLTTGGTPGSNNGAITVVAGPAVYYDASSITVANTGSGSGGNIDFSQGLTALSSHGTQANTVGGNVTLVAYRSGASGGQILLGSTPAIKTGGFDASQKSGNVFLVAASSNSGGISAANGIDTTGGLSGTGSVIVSYSDPLNVTPFGGISISTAGAIGSVNSYAFLYGIQLPGNGTLGPISVTNAAVELHQNLSLAISTLPSITGASSLMLDSSSGIAIDASISTNALSLITRSNIQFTNGANITAPGGIFLVANDNINTVGGGSGLDSSSTTGNGGAITIIAGADYALSNGGSGTVTTIKGFSPQGGGYLDLTGNGSEITTLKSSSSFAGGSGGDITLVSYIGTNGFASITLPSALTVLTGGSGGANGNFTAVAGGATFTATAVKIGDVNASSASVNSVAGGTITLQTAQPGSGFVVSPTGVISAGSPIVFNPAGDGINSITAGTLTSAGGTITVFSAFNVNIGQLNVSNLTGSNINAGSVNVTTNGAQLVLGANSGANYITSIQAAATDASIINGTISINAQDFGNTGTAGITLQGTPFTFTSGHAGSLSLITAATSGDTIDLGSNNNIDLSNTLQGVSQPDGGSITLISTKILASGSVSLSVNGAVGGGGTIVYEVTDTTTLNLSNSGGLKLSAVGGTFNQDANGGSITVESGGNVTYDPASTAINVSPGTGGGNFGSLTLAAGTFLDASVGTPATLSVSGPLNFAGTGFANGGNLTLISNSSTTFNVGLLTGNNNGVQGAISVAGGSLGGSPGSVVLINNGGGVTLTSALTAVSGLKITAGGVGNITLGGAVGTAGISNIALNTNSGGIVQSSTKSIVSGATVSLRTLGAASDIGTSKAAFLVNTNGLTVQSGGGVNINDSASGLLTLGTSSAGTGAFTLVDKTAAIATASATTVIQAQGSVTLSALGEQLNGSVNSSQGLVSIVATNGDLVATSGDITGKTSVTLTASAGKVNFSTVGQATGSTGAITILGRDGVIGGNLAATNAVSVKTTSTKAGLGGISILGAAVSASSPAGVVTVTAANGDLAANFADFSAGKSVTLSAAKGSVTISSAGQASTGTIAITALNGIKVSSSLDAVTSVTLKSTSAATTKAPGLGDITVGGHVTATDALKGVVALTASGDNGIVLTGGASAGKSVTLTAAKGSITSGQIGNSVNTGAVVVTALNKITFTNDVDAVNSITVKTTTTSTDPTKGIITINGNMVTSSPTAGVIAVTATGFGTAITSLTGSNISATKSVTLTASKGALSVGGVTSSGATTGVVTLSALNGLTTIDPIVATNSVVLKTTSATGLITVGGNVRATSAAGVVSVTSGASDIVENLPADISASKSVTLTAAKGSVTINQVGFASLAGLLTVKALHDITDNGSIATVGPVSLATTSKTLTDGITINGSITTTTGAVSVITPGGFLNTGAAASILAQSGTSKTKATILLQDNNLLGGINLGSNTSIITGNAGGSNITIAVGPAPSKGTNSTNPSPGTITVVTNPPGGTVFFGPAGGVDPASVGTITVQGANVTFNAPSTPGGAIKFLGGATITADPPAAGALQSVSMVNAPVIQVDPVGATPAVQIQTPVQASLPVQAVSAIPLLTAVPLPNQQLNIAPTPLGSVTALGATALQTLNLQGKAEVDAEADKQAYRWISDTEVDGGEIPAALLDEMADTAGANAVKNLTHGSLLAMPQQDCVVKTPCGDVAVEANSVVLIMAFDKGLAVYNFDDRHYGAVKVTSAGSSFAVRPGTSAVIVSEGAKSFSQVNPAQLMCYRRIVEHKLNGGLKAFTSEFALHSGIQAVQPLKAMILSMDAKSRRTAAHLLKTTSILMQLQAGGENFRQVMRPQLTASR